MLYLRQPLLLIASLARVCASFYKKHCEGETLAVADSKLGNAIKEKLVSSISQFITFCEWSAFMGL